ncbi:Conjugative transfer protein TraI, relaxase [Enterobacter hormaechei]|uniref:MobH family relaxase n=1 Tax=Enterobacter hormaechei TaxID=158836 RepID=UPI001256197A|nr:MobH family relaxase [Enterobacter hormaechei]VAE21228.1 Conjugative transfer protein TraI, relaxase [Enterobacter hormaechei]VAE26837.1 Conjugative transfer protein TraI, relaxase [Enterobacter hormaechei]
MGFSKIARLIKGIFVPDGREYDHDEDEKDSTELSILDAYSIPKKPDEDVLKFIEYPSRPQGISVFNERAILSLYRDKFYDIQMRLAIPDSDIGETAPSFTNLVLKPVMELIRWIHLLPASENHHHNGIGGLLSHSIDVGRHALINAYNKELMPIGYQDEEARRRRVYLYAAFICGLVHDIGKILDVDVISMDSSNKTRWDPLKRSLMDWARSENVTSYEIIWRKRHVNLHTVRSGFYLERIINPVCLEFLGSVHRERILDKMLITLQDPMRSKDYLSQCVHSADHFSTGTDLNLIRDPIIGTRSADAATRAIRAVKEKFISLGINNHNDSDAMHIIFIGGEVYFNESAFLDFALSEFSEMNFNFPAEQNGKAALTDALIRRGYVEPYSDTRIVHYFMPGNFSEEQVHALFKTGIANVKTYNLLKLKWVGLLFDSYMLPDNIPGIFTVNESRDFVLVDDKGIRTEFLRPLPGRHNVITIDDTISSNRNVPVAENSGLSLPPFNEQTATGTVVDADEDDVIEETANPALDLMYNSSDVQKNELLQKLETLLKTTELPGNTICLVDGQPYAYVSELLKLVPGLVEQWLIENALFSTSHRTGNLEPEWIVPDVQGKRVIALGIETAGFQISAKSNFSETSLQSLMNNDLYQTITVPEHGAEPEDCFITMSEPLSLPEERFTENQPQIPPDNEEYLTSLFNEFSDINQSDYDESFMHDDSSVPFTPLDDVPHQVIKEVEHKTETRQLDKKEDRSSRDSKKLTKQINPVVLKTETNTSTSTVEAPFENVDTSNGEAPFDRYAADMARLFSPNVTPVDRRKTEKAEKPKVSGSTHTTVKSTKDGQKRPLKNSAVANNGQELTVPASTLELILQTDAKVDFVDYVEIASSLNEIFVSILSSKHKEKLLKKYLFTHGEGIFIAQTIFNRNAGLSLDVNKISELFTRAPLYKAKHPNFTKLFFRLDCNEVMASGNQYNLNFATVIDQLQKL